MPVFRPLVLAAVLFALDAGFAAAAPAPAPRTPAGPTPTQPARAALPSDSVLRLPDRFTDQDGRAFTLGQRRGKPQLVAMFYSSCPYACPLIIDTGRGVDQALSAAERAKLRVLYISLDPARDDARALSALASKRKLDRHRWTLARTGDAGVRRTAAVLGVRYRKLANGEFNHSSELILLDGQGRIVARTDKLGAVPDKAFLAKVKATLARS